MKISGLWNWAKGMYYPPFLSRKAKRLGRAGEKGEGVLSGALLPNYHCRCSSLLLDLPSPKSLHCKPSGKCSTALLCSAKSSLDINVPSCGLNEPGPFSTLKKYRKTTDPICF